MVGERARGAGLEGGVVACGLGIKGVDASQEGVCVLAGTAAIEVGQNEAAGPEGLQVAENFRCLRITPGAGRADGRREGTTFDKGAVLHSNRKERRAIDFFPEICDCGLALLAHLWKFRIKQTHHILSGSSIEPHTTGRS